MSDALRDDDRPIKGVYYARGEEGYTVGYEEVTSITISDVNGSMAPVVWFEVWKSDRLHARLNSALMEQVTYA